MIQFILLLPIFIACGIAQPVEDYYWPKNVITVPPNCPPGQQWVNGECRDIWRFFEVMEHVPPSVLLEKLMVSDLDVPKEQKQIDEEMSVDAVDLLGEPLNKNIINIPNHCPVGFKPDALGFCRPIFGEVV
ncbi:hypothetical protein O3G_MSEX002480 [Manduca sexta]|uniref:Uncharacterized protein n=1 Tax=Manduca sexta TaxID=7130 RepID=A0A921YP13_MANSE|nr:hypothetical protein O3G_MSEX002480 [Manduca sexta]